MKTTKNYILFIYGEINICKNTYAITDMFLLWHMDNINKMESKLRKIKKKEMQPV